MRLKNFYNISFTEAKYYVKNQLFFFNFIKGNSSIVRIFPLEDYYKKEPEVKMNKYRFGITYIKEDNIVVTKNTDELNKFFNYIFFYSFKEFKRCSQYTN